MSGLRVVDVDCLHVDVFDGMDVMADCKRGLCRCSVFILAEYVTTVQRLVQKTKQIFSRAQAELFISTPPPPPFPVPNKPYGFLWLMGFCGRKAP